MKDIPLDATTAYISELEDALEVSNALIVELRQMVEELKSTVKIQTELLSANQAVAKVAKLGRGRPRKSNDDGWLLEAFSRMEGKFVKANRSKKPTDSAVITWYFEQEFRRIGMRESRARAPKFQSKLKRLKNRLGDVRNPIRKLPIK